MVFHAHNHAGQVTFSDDDSPTAEELVEVFRMLVPERPLGSIAMSVDSVAGLVWLNGEPARDVSVRLY